jgi:hypothetical protein
MATVLFGPYYSPPSDTRSECHSADDARGGKRNCRNIKNNGFGPCCTVEIGAKHPVWAIGRKLGRFIDGIDQLSDVYTSYLGAESALLPSTATLEAQS